MSGVREVTRDRSDVLPSFGTLEDPPGVRVSDPIEGRYFDVHTEGSVSLERSAGDVFTAPIDRSVAVRTTELTVPQVCKGFVRHDEDGVVAEMEHFTSHDLPEGPYTIELTAPIKVHVRVTSAMTVETGLSEMRYEFPAETEVFVGARSYHKQPAATITTTADPVDLMRAVSTFGSALKTTDCERSYPTLRGHPPALEYGDELSIPPGLERPDTGVRIEVPCDLPSVFVVAPLAYYLGAEVVPGRTPRLVTESGFEYVLDGPVGFETTVERVLQQAFFFDCITRTEGNYPVNLHERERIEPLVDFEFGELHGRPLAEQLEAYLSVPFEVVEEHVPEWKLTCHVAPEPENAEALPYLVDDLAFVRSPRGRKVSREEAQSAALDDFMRGALTRGATATRSTSNAVPSTLPSLVEPEETNSLEQAWIGEGAPLGASKATIEAFRNGLGRETGDGDIDITVVCNDPEMLDEHDVASDIYGSRDELPFDVTLYTELDAQRLQFVLESETDYLHYIGHIDDEGIQCADGKLDVAELDSVGVDTFFLNACRSYDQGLKLIERGAVGGVVTLDDVLDSGALRVGETLARLLNRGFPLRSALDIARDRSIVGGHYLVLGDGNADIAHAPSLTPHLCDIETREDGYELSIVTYPASYSGMGTIFQPYIGDSPPWYVTSGTIDTFHLDRDDLEEFLAYEPVPVRIDGSFTWSDTLDIDDY
jgi:hypothetical protein